MPPPVRNGACGFFGVEGPAGFPAERPWRGPACAYLPKAGLNIRNIPLEIGNSFWTARFNALQQNPAEAHLHHPAPWLFKSYNGFQRNFSHQDAIAPDDFKLCAVHNLILQDFLCQHFPRGLYGLNTGTLVAGQHRAFRIQRETVSVPDVEKIPWHRIILFSSDNQLPLIVLVPLADSAMENSAEPTTWLELANRRGQMNKSGAPAKSSANVRISLRLRLAVPIE